ncbi:MAG: DDE-type integrase/transposase/recombinase [Chloroflexi bacterium]|nr:DDE-type integrase/transposase/recombinase [Chloroflexota bacterium]
MGTKLGAISSIIAQKAPTARPEEFIRYGYTEKHVPIYLHRPTGKRYVANGALPGRKIPPEHVGMALMMFYNGQSITKISRTLEPVFDTSKPSKASVYEWVTDYTKLAKDAVAKQRPHTGDRWVGDELVVRVGGQKVWVWTVMDIKTRYILASHISRTRTISDVVSLFREARARAGKPPKSILTDKMTAYPDGIERVFGSEVKHVQSQGMTSATNNNLAERLMGTIRERTKIMRGMKSLRTAQMVMGGWDIHYNYFRPHMALKDKTPAEAGELERPFTTWEDVARRDVRPFSQERLREGHALKSGALRARHVFRTRRKPGSLA